MFRNVEFCDCGNCGCGDDGDGRVFLGDGVGTSD